MEEKRSRRPKKSLAQKIADREELLKQAQEKIMGYSITDLRRFLKRTEEPESQPENSKEQNTNDNIC